LALSRLPACAAMTWSPQCSLSSNSHTVYNDGGWSVINQRVDLGWIRGGGFEGTAQAVDQAICLWYNRFTSPRDRWMAEETRDREQTHPVPAGWSVAPLIEMQLEV
jgi:hypothetical protein